MGKKRTGVNMNSIKLALRKPVEAKILACLYCRHPWDITLHQRSLTSCRGPFQALPRRVGAGQHGDAKVHAIAVFIFSLALWL